MLTAYCKCIEEEKSGNSEFKQAKDTIYESLLAMNIQEADVFLEEFLPSFHLTLDELK